jgi:nucleoside-diphosphate-sugar epimerase
MRVFIAGAGGYLGSALARAFTAAGHRVAALARNNEKAAAFAADGLEPIVGDLATLGALRGQLAAMDAIVLAAAIPFDQEWEVADVLIGALEGSEKPFLMTSGTAVLSHETHGGEWRQETYAEDQPFTPPPWIASRVETENRVREASSRGVRTIVVRPPLIWGHGGSKQVPAIFQSVRTAGAACYIGAGLNLYSHVHVDDLAQIYALALESGRPGALYHAVAGEVCWRTLARAVAKVTGTEARSVTIEVAREIWGAFIGPLFFGVSSRSRAVRTRADLGWAPERLDLEHDILEGSYAQGPAAA